MTALTRAFGCASVGRCALAIFSVSLLGCAPSIAGPEQSAASEGQWELVWSDEFDKDGLPDATKWGYEVGFVRNREKQFYTEARTKNARVADGRLIIESHREPFQGAEYTSASVTTQGKAAWTYVRIEVRAKLPSGRGVWPAIWTLGVNRRELGWPACGEIDIMEFVGFNPSTVHANVHTRKYNHVRGNGKGSSIQVERPTEEFHLYATEWSPQRIDFMVDGRKYFSYENEGSGVDAWPFDRPQYLILNTAIGGTWGGREGIDDSIFPQRFEIDYVRVYQRSQDP